MRIVIEAVNYTPGKDAVLIHYATFPGDPTPFPGSHICHTSQTALSKRSGIPGYWSDVEIKTELVNYFSEHGLTVEVVDAIETRAAKASRFLLKAPEPEG